MVYNIKSFESAIGYQFKANRYYDNLLWQFGYDYQRQLRYNGSVGVPSINGAIIAMLRYNKNF